MMTLSQVVGTHSQPIDTSSGLESIEAEMVRLKAVLDRLLPAERASRNHLERELEKLAENKLLLNLQQQCEKQGAQLQKLDMSFMKMCTFARSMGRWLVPQFALVQVFQMSPQTTLTYSHSRLPKCEPSQNLVYLYDMERLEGDIHTLWIFGRDKKRRITFTWQGTMPSQIRGLASTAKDLVGWSNVYLVVDTEGHWECESLYEAPPADPLLVAKVGEGQGAQWVLLGQFDPTPMEQWVAAEMTDVV